MWKSVNLHCIWLWNSFLTHIPSLTSPSKFHTLTSHFCSHIYISLTHPHPPSYTPRFLTFLHKHILETFSHTPHPTLSHAHLTIPHTYLLSLQGLTFPHTHSLTHSHSLRTNTFIAQQLHTAHIRTSL